MALLRLRVLLVVVGLVTPRLSSSKQLEGPNRAEAQEKGKPQIPDFSTHLKTRLDSLFSDRVLASLLPASEVVDHGALKAELNSALRDFRSEVEKAKENLFASVAHLEGIKGLLSAEQLRDVVSHGGLLKLLNDPNTDAATQLGVREQEFAKLLRGSTIREAVYGVLRSYQSSVADLKDNLKVNLSRRQGMGKIVESPRFNILLDDISFGTLLQPQTAGSSPRRLALKGILDHARDRFAPLGSANKAEAASVAEFERKLQNLQESAARDIADVLSTRKKPVDAAAVKQVVEKVGLDGFQGPVPSGLSADETQVLVLADSKKLQLQRVKKQYQNAAQALKDELMSGLSAPLTPRAELRVSKLVDGWVQGKAAIASRQLSGVPDRPENKDDSILAAVFARLERSLNGDRPRALKLMPKLSKALTGFGLKVRTMTSGILRNFLEGEKLESVLDPSSVLSALHNMGLYSSEGRLAFPQPGFHLVSWSELGFAGEVADRLQNAVNLQEFTTKLRDVVGKFNAQLPLLKGELKEDLLSAGEDVDLFSLLDGNLLDNFTLRSVLKALSPKTRAQDSRRLEGLESDEKERAKTLEVLSEAVNRLLDEYEALVAELEKSVERQQAALAAARSGVARVSHTHSGLAQIYDAAGPETTSLADVNGQTPADDLFSVIHAAAYKSPTDRKQSRRSEKVVRRLRRLGVAEDSDGIALLAPAGSAHPSETAADTTLASTELARMQVAVNDFVHALAIIRQTLLDTIGMDPVFLTMPGVERRMIAVLERIDAMAAKLTSALRV